MKKIVLCALALSLCACKSTDIRNITSSVADIAAIGASTTTSSSDGSFSTNSSTPEYSHKQQQYSTASENIYITNSDRTKRNYGAIRSIESEKNPKGMTMVRFLSYQQDSGAPMKSSSYLYAIDSNGWTSQKSVSAHYAKTIMINSGQYYLKARSSQGEFYTTGTLTLLPGVTNVVTIDLQ
ncbi:hypothetical protein [Shewanella pneumatophori]|uniref:Lipoprotein n=1 Tax=Shewanella pneumatophori TaxID=314092 RepID=A0A9X2CFD0_9GAMM|nr:hypothetical protein [Shewanella pneumatophori]MCL1137671.1 hypothetical protein [Shewanella pneumatophori]